MKPENGVPVRQAALVSPRENAGKDLAQYSINSYRDYLDYLLAYSRYHGEMTPIAIHDLIYGQDLVNRFGITYQDVKADLEHLDTLEMPNLQAYMGRFGEEGSSQTVRRELKNQEEYVNALKKHIAKWEDKAYLDEVIEWFVVEYGLAEDGGADEVSPAAAGSKKSGRADKICQYKADIRIDLAMVNAGQRPMSRLFQSFLEKQEEKEAALLDEAFVEQLGDVVWQYGHLIPKQSAFKGILWDFFPNMKKEIHILVRLLETGIAEDIREQDVLEDMFVNRYVNRLANEYGISEAASRRMVEIWCIAYGRNYLHKTVEF